MTDIIVFDFDGVIADSRKECFLTTLCAYKKLLNITKETYLTPSTTNQVEALFNKYRYLVGPANEFYFLIAGVFEHINSNGNNVIELFDHLKKNNQSDSEDFVTDFFAIRKMAMAKFLADWINLNPCYKQIPEILNCCIKDKNVFIASTKDVESIVTLLATYNVSLPQNHILGKEFSTNKFLQLQQIIKQTSIDCKNIALIDDNLGHLEAVRPLGIKLFLATWGYNSPAERKAAKNFGAHLISIDELGTELGTE